MQNKTIPTTYKDQYGTVKTDLKTDGHKLYLTLRDIAFEGVDFESLEGKRDSSKFDYCLEYDDLTNFTMEVVFPLTIVHHQVEIVHKLECTIVVKHKELTKIDAKLVGSFGLLTLRNQEEFEYVLINLQKKLPKNHSIKSCLSCRYADYHPVGNGIFGGLHCFVNLKEEVLRVTDKFEFMDLWTDEHVANETIFNVQETFLCGKHEFVQEADWVYKGWDEGFLKC